MLRVQKIKSAIIIFYIFFFFQNSLPVLSHGFVLVCVCVSVCMCDFECVCVRQCVEGLMAEEIREYNVASGEGESSAADKKRIRTSPSVHLNHH